MRLGLYGGSFDPVHYGHLVLAECCREQRALDRVLLLPAGQPPHKQDRELSPAAHRVEMLRLAVAGHEAFHVSREEVDRGGVSYTVQTLEHFHQEHPESALFLLLGADMLNDLPHWYQAARVCELATPVVVRRAGMEEPDFNCLRSFLPPHRVAEIQCQQVEMPEIGLSSTDLRRRVAAGQSIRFRTPRAVEKYIETQGLYRAMRDEG